MASYLSSDFLPYKTLNELHSIFGLNKLSELKFLANKPIRLQPLLYQKYLLLKLHTQRSKLHYGCTHKLTELTSYFLSELFKNLKTHTCLSVCRLESYTTVVVLGFCSPPSPLLRSFLFQRAHTSGLVQHQASVALRYRHVY